MTDSDEVLFLSVDDVLDLHNDQVRLFGGRLVFGTETPLSQPSLRRRQRSMARSFTTISFTWLTNRSADELVGRPSAALWRSQLNAGTLARLVRGMADILQVRMCSAGHCAVCAGAGAAIFLASEPEGLIFFACAECGCAWARPPTPLMVDRVDSPLAFAPKGFRLASLRDIDAAGLASLIRDDHAERSSSGFAGTPGYR